MNPLAVEELAQSHYQEIVQLAQASRAARASQPLGRWRRAVSQALVRMAVGLGTPRPHRRVVLREARALLDDCYCV